MKPISQQTLRAASFTLTVFAVLACLTLPSLSAPSGTVPQSLPVSLAAPTPPVPDSPMVSAALDKARAFAYQSTHEPIGPLGKLAVSQLQAFGAAMGIPAAQLQNARVADYGTYVTAVTDHWIYDADVSGNQALRPMSVLPYLVPGFDHAGSLTDGSDLAAQITTKARGIVSALGLKADLKNAYCKKEQVLVGKCGPDQPLSLYDERCLVLLGTDDGTFLHLICDSKCNPIRVETNIECDATKRLSDLLYQQIKAGAAFPVMSSGADDMTFGTFFDQNEAKFEGDAFSFEGVKFPASVLVPIPSNEAIEGLRGERLVFAQYNQDGRMGSVRGNLDNLKNSWQRNQIQVLHRNMRDYPISQRFSKDYVIMGDPFYQDLEQCVAAAVFSHGGPTAGSFTVDSGHGFFAPEDQKHKLGQGLLRHVFFESCDSIDFLTPDENYKSLISEWLPSKYVDGIRTVCGTDGGLNGLDRDGWRFFDRYNKGDAIEAAWMYQSIVECAQNAPVTVAYGSSPAEALTTLTEGRFSKERAEPTYSVASLWRDIK